MAVEERATHRWSKRFGPDLGERFTSTALKGRTPIALTRVPAGVHQVEVRRAVYETASKRVVVRPGARPVISLVLRARRRLEPRPLGAVTSD